VNNANWWASKLASNTPQAPQGRPVNNVPMPPSQQPMAPMPSFQPQAQRGLPSSSQTASCPDCGSSNYMSVQNTKPRCLDCGYPIEQSGSRYGSLAGAKVQGSAKQASGNDVTNNYNPQQIIGRID
jgi:ribosomal protein L37E